MKRPFLTAGLTLLTTLLLSEICGYYGYPALPSVAASVLCAAAGVLLLLSNLPHITLKTETKAFILTVCACVAVGVTLWSFSDSSYKNLVNSGISADCDTYTVSTPINTQTAYGYSTNVICQSSGAKITLYTNEKLVALPGDTLSGNVSRAINRSAAEYFRSSGVHLTGRTNNTLKITENPSFSPSRLLYMLKNAVKGSLGLNMGESYGFLSALILGDKSDLSVADKDTLQKAGVYHICAVSGLHVSIMTTFLIFIIGLLGFKKSRSKFLVLVPALILLLGVTGFSLSALRAVFMTSSALLGGVFKRKTDSLNGLGLALTVILLLSPFAAFSASLLLSFGATLGIILFTEPLKKAIITTVFKNTGHVLSAFTRFFVNIFATSAAATVFTLTVSAVFFQSSSLCGLLANIFVLPAVSFVYYAAVLAVFFSFIPFCGAVTLFFSQTVILGVRFIMHISSVFSRSFLSNIDFSVGTIIACAAVAVVAAFVYYSVVRGKETKRKKRVYAYSALVFAAVFLVTVFGGSALKAVTDPDDGLYRVAYIDVGQGSSSVITYGDSAVIIDCGGSNKASDSISSYLRKNGVKSIDFIIITHLHADHANAISALAAEWKIPEIIIPFTEGDINVYNDVHEVADNENAALTVLSADETRRIANMTINILTKHLDDAASDQNDNSLVVIAENSDFKALFAGDVTQVSEMLLIDEYGKALDSDFLAIPHHGSKYSSSSEFLAAVSPHLSVVSVGTNSYGHPTDEALERIIASGSKVLTTMDCGTIEAVTDGSETEILYGN